MLDKVFGKQSKMFRRNHCLKSWFSKDNQDKIVIPSQGHIRNTNS